MKKYIAIMLALALTAATSFISFAAADDERPSDVENLKAVPLNGAVKLSWDEAYDNVSVAGYIVHFGDNGLDPNGGAGQSFDSTKDVKNVTEYTLTGLTNGTEYFFSVVAYDAAGNESANWAVPVDVSATPSADADSPEDGNAPTVASAEALNKVEVKVVFSEPVVLPKTDPQDEFSIENDETFEPLVVSGAKMDEEDEEGKTVILTTAEQTKDISYTLTVGINVKDKAGNPIISGTSDTAAFTGSGAEKPAEGNVANAAETEDNVAPEIESVEAVDNTHISITFSEPIVLSIDPSKDFKIVQVDDETKELEVLGVELEANAKGVEDTVALITTSPQEDVQYRVTVSAKDEAGNEFADDEEGLFRGVKVADNGDDEEPADTIPPEDVAKFMATKLIEAEKTIVKLTWEIVSAENADAVKQTIYQKKAEKDEYNKVTDLEADITEYELKNLEMGEYWFKITQTDEAGNESEGEVVKVVLSETGPEMLGLLLLSVGAGRLFRRRK